MRSGSFYKASFKSLGRLPREKKENGKQLRAVQEVSRVGELLAHAVSGKACVAAIVPAKLL